MRGRVCRLTKTIENSLTLPRLLRMLIKKSLIVLGLDVSLFVESEKIIQTPHLMHIAVMEAVEYCRP